MEERPEGLTRIVGHIVPILNGRDSEGPQRTKILRYLLVIFWSNPPEKGGSPLLSCLLMHIISWKRGKIIPFLVFPCTYWHVLVSLMRLQAFPKRMPLKYQTTTNGNIPVTTLTPYHALKLAALKINEFLVIFGASGNTGMMATQFGQKIGAKVIAVSKQKWINDFGADYIITEYDKEAE